MLYIAFFQRFLQRIMLFGHSILCFEERVNDLGLKAPRHQEDSQGFVFMTNKFICYNGIVVKLPFLEEENERI